jgi:hypothetical protein
MHGLIHSELRKFVEEVHGAGMWKQVLEEAGLPDQAYSSTGAYPDQEAFAIVKAAARITATPAEDILESYGEFLAPTLMRMFQALIPPGWKTLEMLLNTEETIHTVVRVRNPGASPPRLRFEQTGPNTLRFNYESPRRMSALAKGIMKGIASHYGETLDIRERKGAAGSSEMTITIT